MRFLTSVTLFILLLFSTPVAAACSTLYNNYTWIIVQDGDEAIEYNAKSRNPAWSIDALTDAISFCADCGQVQFFEASSAPKLLEFLRAEAATDNFNPNGDPVSVQLGPLKGKAQRFTTDPMIQQFQDWIVLEASDGCVSIVLQLLSTHSLEHSPFRDPNAIADATAVTRITRGKAQNFDIRCLKQSGFDHFEWFRKSIGVEPPEPVPPIKTPSHEEFMRGLQRLN